MLNPTVHKRRRASGITSFFLALFLLAATTVGAETTIAQVDSSYLLTRQLVDIYVNVRNASGRVISGLGPNNFALFEGPSETELYPVQDFDLEEGVNASDGISFYLLVDNSGSMYDRLDGSSTDRPEETRMAMARKAMESFLSAVDNPKDTVGLASFNTNYRANLFPTNLRSSVEDALGDIKTPTKDESYTELYAALSEAADDLGQRKGRKVIILLTDGENYPYATHSGKSHPRYGDRISTSQEAIDSLVLEGISVFPVHFGPARHDANLRSIAGSTGGKIFDARDQAELANAYLDIRERVLREYRLRYRPSMRGGDRRVVRVEYRGPGGPWSAEQYYFTGTIFGSDTGPLSPLLLIPFLLAPLAWFALTRLKLLNTRSDSNLEILDGGSTQIFSLSEGRTVIGSSDGDLTIARSRKGEPPASGDVTVIKDAATGHFTIVSSKPIMVNNQPTSNRRLSPGDVIRMGDATVVFDEGAGKPTTAAKKPGPPPKNVTKSSTKK